MMGWPSVSALATSGGSAWSGRLPRTREMRSRTSLAASSMLRSSENSMETRERPSRLDEVTRSMPWMPAMRCSIGSVIRLSITSAEAPG